MVADQRESDRCDYCQSRLPAEPIESTLDGVEYRFCTEACRDATLEGDRVFTTYRGHRWLRPGVAALDASLPQGLLRNTALLISARPGTRDTELHTELVWRTLERGERAIYITFQEPPVSVVNRFLSLDWNVLPALERGDLHVLDCFTYRLEDRDRMFDRLNDWNAHLRSIAESEVTAVRDPTNIAEIENRIDDCASALGMVDTGLIVIDSLTEFGSLIQPVRAYDFVKDIRAELCQGRFVPLIAGAAYTGDGDQFPHDLEYLFDGIVDLELNPKIVEDALIKRLRVRKLTGALSYPEWRAYEFTAGEGLVTFDPKAEMEQAAADANTSSNGGDDAENTG